MRKGLQALVVEADCHDVTLLRGTIRLHSLTGSRQRRTALDHNKNTVGLNYHTPVIPALEHALPVTLGHDGTPRDCSTPDSPSPHSTRCHPAKISCASRSKECEHCHVAHSGNTRCSWSSRDGSARTADMPGFHRDVPPPEVRHRSTAHFRRLMTSQQRRQRETAPPC